MDCMAFKSNGKPCGKYADMVVDYGMCGRFVCRQHVGYYVTSALGGNDKATPTGNVTVYGIAAWREHTSRNF